MVYALYRWCDGMKDLRLIGIFLQESFACRTFMYFMDVDTEFNYDISEWSDPSEVPQFLNLG